ncbi:winged helix-turn-helix transcriptional regulator [Levilactobacillus lanxiensis]|uniref:Winged helix-turn-helix transcriptional regulator n=1 Tax=Levilactobacillus lanxiensis TaxID=2799568 RepID=A0ABW4D4B8_9LACO|nr:helix-turn-helix domain-containing protein [Levilactobacillus lanxiensis]
MKVENEAATLAQCPIAPSQKILRGKWTLVILYFLSQGVLRFGELQRKLPNVTQASLTKQLRLLEEYKIVHREVYKQVPPKVEYSLTEVGQGFIPVLTALEKWTTDYQELQ